jgi:hypothetical protein
MADNLGVSAEKAPALADIRLEQNLDHYRSLLAELR